MYFGHKLSYNDQNEMILIFTENRLIELQLHERSLGKICLVCSQKIVQVKVKKICF